MARKLTVKPSLKAAIIVDRRAVRAAKLVYVIRTPKRRKYPNDRSRIIYIGTTKTGVHRVASSISSKAIEFLQEWGVRSLDVCFITCPPNPGIRSWECLERDLLIAFKFAYGRVPEANTTGKNFAPDKLSGLFQWSRLVKVLAKYE